MSRKDWIGLSLSVSTHALLLLALSFVLAKPAPTPQFGYIDVDLGPLQAPDPGIDTSQDDPTEDAQTSGATDLAPVEEAIDDPASAPPPEIDEAETVEQVDSPSSSTEGLTDASDDVLLRPQNNVQSLTSKGSTGGNQATAQDPLEGQGPGAQSLYNIQGELLNRSLLRSDPMPRNVESVRGRMTVQLVVSPSGQVTGVVPIRRISPAVDREVLNAVRQWVFQPLAGNVPQQSQRGTIEFIFTAN